LVSTGISWWRLNQIVCALRFFYGVTLGRPEVPERIAYAGGVERGRGRAVSGSRIGATYLQAALALSRISVRRTK
jgi:hypothetical protein